MSNEPTTQGIPTRYWQIDGFVGNQVVHLALSGELPYVAIAHALQLIRARSLAPVEIAACLDYDGVKRSFALDLVMSQNERVLRCGDMAGEFVAAALIDVLVRH